MRQLTRDIRYSQAIILTDTATLPHQFMISFLQLVEPTLFTVTHHSYFHPTQQIKLVQIL